MKPLPWWERWPGRLEYELAELNAAGIRHEVDQGARRAAIIRVRAWPTPDGNELPVVATYPDLHPYFRPEVQAPTLDLKYHQNPFQKNLCLLGRRSGNWQPRYTVAWLLTVQLPELLRVVAETERAKVADAEEQQAEPFGEYYPYEHQSAILVDTNWEIDAAENTGTAVVMLAATAAFGGPASPRGAVTVVRAKNGRVLAEAAPGVSQAISGPSIVAPWVRVAEPLREPTATRFWKAVQPLLAATPKKLLWNDIMLQLQLVGVLLPQEVRWRDDRLKEGWLFLARIERNLAVPPPWSHVLDPQFNWHSLGPAIRAAEQLLHAQAGEQLRQREVVAAELAGVRREELTSQVMGDEHHLPRRFARQHPAAFTRSRQNARRVKCAESEGRDRARHVLFFIHRSSRYGLPRQPMD